MTYTPDRSRDGPARVFEGFGGYLQADAYPAYDALFAGGDVVEVGCWMHARRKFYEARTSDPARSHLMLAWVAGLYEVEGDAREARKKHPEWDDEAWHAYRHDLRLARSKPILDAIHAWLEAERPKVLAEEPDRRGDRVCVEPLGRPDPALGGGFPGDRQRRQRAGAEAGRAGAKLCRPQDYAESCASLPNSFDEGAQANSA